MAAHSAFSLTGLLVLTVALLAPLAGAGPVEAQTELTKHTLTHGGSEVGPAASIEDVAWLQGRWVGQGLGAVVEEVWLPPAGGRMVGVFRLVRNDRVVLYEFVTLEEDRGSLILRLKHFGPDLVGWEAKDESVSFPLVRREQDVLWFDGLTIRRLDDGRMEIWAALETREGGVREELFEYRRAVGPDSPLR